MQRARRLTHVRKVLTSVRLERRERDLMYLAALREGISQSMFLRQAVRAHAERVLRGEPR